MKLLNIKQIEPEPSMCISVDSDNKLFSLENGLLTRNSVCQQSVIISCLVRPEYWAILGIDMKKVELSRFRKHGMSVATDIETATEFLRFAQAVMMKRYEKMEELGVNNFMDLPDKSQALMVMIDELGELLSPTGIKALAWHTFVPNLNGKTKLEDIEIGDTVFNSETKPVTVLNKYKPISQEQYRIIVECDKTEEQEVFVSGKEHMWVVQLKGVEDENIFKEAIVDTETLMDLHKNGEIIKFKRTVECEV